MKANFRYLGNLATGLALFTSAAHVKAVEYVIGTDPWPPFTIMDEGEYRGIDVDIANELQRRLPDISFRFQRIPWVRALRYMEQGKIDAITGLAKTDERSEYIQYTSPPYYSECSSVFYVRKESGIQISSYEDLYRYKVGYVLNSAYFERFDKDDKLRKHSVSDEDQLLDMLIHGRIDTIIGTNCQIQYHIKIKGALDQVEEANWGPKNNVDLYFGLSKRSAIVAEQHRLNAAIKSLKDEGVIEKIVKQYFE